MTRDPLALATDLARLVMASQESAERRVVGIAGESGSGKSVTATKLVEVLTASGRPSVALHQDDYFHRPPRTNHEYRERDLASVGPQEVDLAALAAHVARFRVGDDGVVVPSVDYPGNRFTTRVLDFASRDVLVVDGTYVLALPDLDVRIFLDATSADTRERRHLRNRDIEAPVVERVLAIEHGLISPQAELADIVIDREFRIVRTGGRSRKLAE
ncbi:MAG: hypothetical protein ABI141_07245 [Gemmatimonadaceae bacterium]